MNVLTLFDAPIAYHRVFVDITGSVSAAVLLSQAIYWQKRSDIKRGPNSQWYKTREEWFEETGLRRDQLERARKKCAGILEYKKSGMPLKTWYRVNTQVLEQKLQDVENQAIAGEQPSARMRIGMTPAALLAGIPPITNTTETTTETTPYNPPTGDEPQIPDAAVNLLNAYRAEFPHVKRRPDPEETKKELKAASSLLASAEPSEIIGLAKSALADKFAGNRRAASSLRELSRNFQSLRAQFPEVLSASVPVINRHWEGVKTDAEMWEDWDRCVIYCREHNIPLSESEKPTCPRPPRMPQERLGGIHLPSGGEAHLAAVVPASLAPIASVS